MPKSSVKTFIISILSLHATHNLGLITSLQTVHIKQSGTKEG